MGKLNVNPRLNKESAPLMIEGILKEHGPQSATGLQRLTGYGAPHLRKYLVEPLFVFEWVGEGRTRSKVWALAKRKEELLAVSGLDKNYENPQRVCTSCRSTERSIRAA